MRQRLFINPMFMNFSRLSSSGFKPRAKDQKTSPAAKRNSPAAIRRMFAGLSRTRSAFCQPRRYTQAKAPSNRRIRMMLKRRKGSMWTWDNVQTTNPPRAIPSGLAKSEPPSSPGKRLIANGQTSQPTADSDNHQSSRMGASVPSSPKAAKTGRTGRPNQR